MTRRRHIGRGPPGAGAKVAGEAVANRGAGKARPAGQSAGFLISRRAILLPIKEGFAKSFVWQRAVRDVRAATAR